MEIILNGKVKEIPEESSLLQLFEEAKYNDTKTAVWINGKQLLYADYKFRMLESGDEVKIMRILGGG